MSSGGFSFTSLLHPEKTAKSYIAKKTENSLLGSLKMPSLSIPGFSTKGKLPMGQLNSSKSGPALPSIIFKVIALVTLSAFLGTFFVYIHKREQDFNYDSIEKGAFVVVLLVMGLAIAFAAKFSLLDFIISSEINIMATYLLVSYIVLQIGVGSSPFEKIKTFFTDLWDSIKNPSSVFTKPDLFLSLIFIIIPLLVLINNATENIFLAITVLVVSLGSVYMLYPKNNSIPIGV